MYHFHIKEIKHVCRPQQIFSSHEEICIQLKSLEFNNPIERKIKILIPLITLQKKFTSCNYLPIATAGELAFLLTLTIALHDKANDAANKAGNGVALI